MAIRLPPPPTDMDPSGSVFRDWFFKLSAALGNFFFTDLNFTGSNITSIETRNHEDLQNLNTDDYTHLTSVQATDLTDGGDTALHYHSSDRDLANATGVLGIAKGGTNSGTTPTNGQLLIGNGTDFSLSTLTAGPNVSISNGSGIISISSTGGGGGSSTYNVLTSDTEVVIDTSMLVVGDLNLNGFDLEVNGNLGFI